MEANTSPRSSLQAECDGLRERLGEAEDILAAIRSGDVDALVVESPSGPRLFTMPGVDAETNRLRGEILSQISDAVIVSDGEQRIAYLNAAAEKLYGVSASEALGRPISKLYSIRWRKPEEEVAE